MVQESSYTLFEDLFCGRLQFLRKEDELLGAIFWDGGGLNGCVKQAFMKGQSEAINQFMALRPI